MPLCCSVWRVATCTVVPVVTLNNSSVNTSCLFPYVAVAGTGCPILSSVCTVTKSRDCFTPIVITDIITATTAHDEC